MMRILKIIKQTGADGPGLRNSLYVAGCPHHCRGCHNPESWDINNGYEMSIPDIIKELVDPYSDITISGGDPFSQPIELLELLKGLEEFKKNIWVFTGYEYSYLKEYYPEHLAYINIIVDGRYDESKQDLSRFAGSSNQSIIKLKK